MTLDEIRRLPNVTAATCAAPHLGWPERGVKVWGSDRVGIVCFAELEDIRTAHFQSHNYKQFHYIADGPWSDWVALAKAILEVDAKLD